MNADVLKTIESLIEKSEGKKAAEMLSDLNYVELKKEELPLYAQLSWRVNLPELGLRALAKHVRPDLKSLTPASPAEKAEYAACLHRIGALAEAEKFLSDCDEKAYPRVVLYKAAIAVSHWDYEKALPLFASFAKTEGISNYERLVSKVNIAECLIVLGEMLKAQTLLRELRYDTSLNQYAFAMGKVFELAGQHAIITQNRDAAGELLEEAYRLCELSNTIHPLTIRKFKLFHEMGDNPSERDLKEAGRVIAEAIRLRHWETVRDIERKMALLTQSKEAYRKVYFGTPFKAFRNRLEGAWPEIDLESSFRWSFGEADSDVPTLSLFDSNADYGSKLVHSLLISLSKDFYRPRKVAALFADIYPDEAYLFESSPLKVRQIVYRGRQWLEKNFPSLEIVREQDGFRLKAKAPCSVLCFADQTTVGNHPSVIRLEKLRALGLIDVSPKITSKALGLSVRSASRLLSEGIERGILIREGKGRQTRYRFKDAR